MDSVSEGMPRRQGWTQKQARTPEHSVLRQVSLNALLLLLSDDGLLSGGRWRSSRERLLHQGGRVFLWTWGQGDCLWNPWIVTAILPFSMS